MSEQVNPVKVVCNIVDDRMLALFLVHEDITLHCFLPAVSPWRICTVFHTCIPSDTILLSLSVWTVRYLCRLPVKITGSMDTLPPTSVRNGSTPSPRMAMCVETLGTQQPRAHLLGCFSKRNVPVSVVYGCQSSKLCCDWWMSLRTDLRFDIAGVLKWLHFKICCCLQHSQYRAWSWWTVMHVKQKFEM